MMTQVPIYAAYLYDAVNVYARALKEALDEGVNPKNGTAVVASALKDAPTTVSFVLS